MFQPEDKTEYLYHQTNKENLANIKTKGLTSSGWENAYDEHGKYIDSGIYDDTRQVIWFSGEEKPVTGNYGELQLRVAKNHIADVADIVDANKNWSGDGFYAEQESLDKTPWSVSPDKIEFREIVNGEPSGP